MENKKIRAFFNLCTKLMLLMGLGVKGGDTITVTIEGGEEEKAAAAMKEFLEKEL